MSTSDLVAYIQQLSIDDDNSPAVPTVMPLRNRRSATDNGPEMIGDVVSIFAPGISQENKKAAENCILLAELRANQLVSKNQSLAYFEAFYDVLNKIGWYTLSSIGSNQMSSGHTASPGREFINILTNLATTGIMPGVDVRYLINNLEIVANALETNVGGLWSQSSRRVQRSGFYIALVSQTADGSSPVITFNAFDLTVKLSGFSFFWLESKSEAYQIKTERRMMAISPTNYNRIKDALEEKLTGKVTQYIKEIDIGDF